MASARRRSFCLTLCPVLAAMVAAPFAGAAEAPRAPVAASRAEAEPLPEREVRAVQDALIWTGDYTGVVNGTLGSRTRDAIAAYLRRTGTPGAGPLDAGARARLLAEAQAKRQAVGFAPVADKRAGLVLSLPMKLLPREAGTDFGMRFSSPDGDVVVDTLSRPAASAGLPEVFARMSATAGARKVTYKLLRPDFFVVSGEIGDRSFYSRFAQGRVDGADLVRGFTVSYPKAAAARLDAVTLAIAASFDPFPVASKPAVVGAASPSGVPPVPSTPAAPGSTPAFSEAVVVGPGLALSRVSRSTCANPRINGTPVAYRLEDARTGLALLAVPDGTGSPVPLAAESVRDGAPLFGLFHGASDQAGKAGPLLAGPVEVRQVVGPDGARFTVAAPFQRRGAAPPVFDRFGALAGLAERNDKDTVAVSGTVPEAEYRVTSALDIKAFLDRAGVVPANPGPAGNHGVGDLVSALRPSVMTVSCFAENQAAP